MKVYDAWEELKFALSAYGNFGHPDLDKHLTYNLTHGPGWYYDEMADAVLELMEELELKHE